MVIPGMEEGCAQVATRHMGRWICLWLALLPMGCFESPETEIIEKVSLAKVKISAIREHARPDDQEATDLLEHAANRISTAEKYLTEDDHFQALAVVDDLLFRLDNYLQFGEDGGSKKLRAYGSNTSWQNQLNGDFMAIQGEEKPEEIRGLKAGFRSAIVLKLQDDTKLYLLSESEVKLTHHASSVTIELVQGSLRLDKPQAGQAVVVKEGNFMATLDTVGNIELGKNAVTSSRYLGNYLGTCSWQLGSQSGSLEQLQALSYTADASEVINLPSAPRIENPENHSTQHPNDQGNAVVPFRWYTQAHNDSYQLQISEDEQFVTRVFDDPSLADSFKDVDLKAGEYNWRVRGFKQDSQGNRVPGPYTQTMVVYVSAEGLDVVPNGQSSSADPIGPKPSVTGVTFKTIGTSIIATGRTDPSMRVKINGVSAIVSEDGQFRAIIESRAGTQTMRLVVTNPNTGAVTIQEHKIKI